MIILGIETATQRAGVALGGPDGLLASIETGGGRRHAESLNPAVEQACQHAGITIGEIGAVAIDIGPGLFTGMRVGIAAAKAFAYALELPMIAVSSLDLVAFPLRFSAGRVAAVIDARKGQVFYAFYAPVPGGVQRLGEPVVGSLDELVAELQLSGEHHILVGDGALRYRDQLTDVIRCDYADEFLNFPSAAALVYLARGAALRGQWTDAALIQPMYLREPDAQINWQVRQGAR